MEIQSRGSQSEIDFIKDKPHLIFLVQKAEKLAGVVHVLTFNMSESEPLRSNLRESCLLFLRHVFNRDLENRYATSLESDIAYIISLLNIGLASLSISQMNVEVLKRELLALLPLVAMLHQKERADISFDQKAMEINGYKGHLEMSNSNHYPIVADSAERTSFQGKKDDKFKKTGYSESIRKNIIIEVIRNKRDVSIKDISLQVRGVSGKTIQRDLIDLVSHGVLKKTGERRWSRYSLV